jgi:4-oxalocrotonate tautomerase
VALVRITVGEGVFSANQKRQIVEGVTEVLAAVGDERIRAATWVIVDEVRPGDWSVGGRVLTTDELIATAAATAARGEESS